MHISQSWLHSSPLKHYHDIKWLQPPPTPPPHHSALTNQSPCLLHVRCSGQTSCPATAFVSALLFSSRCLVWFYRSKWRLRRGCGFLGLKVSGRDLKARPWEEPPHCPPIPLILHPPSTPQSWTAPSSHSLSWHAGKDHRKGKQALVRPSPRWQVRWRVDSAHSETLPPPPLLAKSARERNKLVIAPYLSTLAFPLSSLSFFMRSWYIVGPRLLKITPIHL